jgi:hypothetical protein
VSSSELAAENDADQAATPRGPPDDEPSSGKDDNPPKCTSGWGRCSAWLPVRSVYSKRVKDSTLGLRCPSAIVWSIMGQGAGVQRL